MPPACRAAVAIGPASGPGRRPMRRAGRRVVVTALTGDRRILRQWELDLDQDGRVAVPEGTRAVHVTDPGTGRRVRVRFGAGGTRTTAPTDRNRVRTTAWWGHRSAP
ncbi:hypothetical protein [Pseudonocardia sp. HH130630-07]|uniref:hypothetical protein n=1 Tax=Pseudonocardia sp. HH130630-07 TaxID=1690815 RepID=UPI0008150C1F|nr:hypothetical protein [Pseudonocardia sp. HH130630-07]ANY07525.1 hypothetical protein AFB00_15870 [Pseudonocardia sp. HH130630-07]